MAMELGLGALMAKLDIQSAYRMIPVHPGDRRLLGMSCGGHLYGTQYCHLAYVQPP